MVRLFTLSKKICVSATILNKDVCAERNVSSGNWNDRITNNHIDKNGLSYIDRKLIGLNNIEQTKHIHTHSGVDNYLYNDNIHTPRSNVSCKNVCNDIWPPGFPNKKTIFNSTSSIPRPHSLNPSATSFFPENLASQINYESPSFDEHYSFEDNDNFCEPYHNNALAMTSRDTPKRKSNRPKLRNSDWKHNIMASENDTINITVLSQNVQGLKQDSKLEHIIDQMNEKHIDVALIQETWLTGDFSRIINGFHILHHGLKNENCRRGERGVAIILSPTGFEAYKSAGELPPITSSTNGLSSSGRRMSVNLRIKVHFKCIKGAFRKNRLKHINLDVTIVSTFLPVDHMEHDEMLEFVDSKMSEHPTNNILVIGQDNNAKVGV